MKIFATSQTNVEIRCQLVSVVEKVSFSYVLCINVEVLFLLREIFNGLCELIRTKACDLTLK